MWVMGTTQARPSGHARLGLVWLVFVGFLMLSVYFIASAYVGHHPSSCGDFSMLGEYHGGQVSGGSLLSALLIGCGLWLAAVVVVVWWPRLRLLLVVTGFVELYAVALAVLWAVAPYVWGPRVWSC
jgi:hypothetical protein